MGVLLKGFPEFTGQEWWSGPDHKTAQSYRPLSQTHAHTQNWVLWALCKEASLFVSAAAQYTLLSLEISRSFHWELTRHIYLTRYRLVHAIHVAPGSPVSATEEINKTHWAICLRRARIPTKIFSQPLHKLSIDRLLTVPIIYYWIVIVIVPWSCFRILNQAPKNSGEKMPE